MMARTSHAVSLELVRRVGCHRSPALMEKIQGLIQQIAPQASLLETVVERPEDQRRHCVHGSPTLKINGLELEGPLQKGQPRGALCCRAYDTPDRLPPSWLLEAALLRALRPRHILFLCVANSARSQLAEALGRRLAPPGVQVSSAGSAPSFVRPQALQVLQDIGIDASTQYSKGIHEVDLETVEAVITLCQGEVCPVLPRELRGDQGRVVKLHWALPDPAAEEGSPQARLEAFASVRDELQRRLKVLFSGWE